MYVESCPFCGADGKSALTWDGPPANQVALAPGDMAAIDMNWDSSGGSCQWADWAGINFNWTEGYDARTYADFLLIPSGWPLHICSSVRSFGYRSAWDSPSTGGQSGPALRVSVTPDTVYSDERATLHVVLDRPTEAGAEAVGCASLYDVRRDSPLAVRLDPLPTVGNVRVPSYTAEQEREDKERAWPQWKTDFKRDCAIPAGAQSADAEIDASNLATVTHIEWRTAPAPGLAPAFLAVPANFTVLDVDALEPNWGEVVRGIRAGLSVDRARFAAGERVPIHTRWENLDAAVPLGEGECHDPEPDLEIQDSGHQVLRTLSADQLSADRICMGGHMAGPGAIAKGATRHEFRELTTTPPPVPAYVTPIPSVLPGPGVYYLVSVWSPRVLAQFGEVYATARSQPVRIEIVEGASQQRP